VIGSELEQISKKHWHTSQIYGKEFAYNVSFGNGENRAEGEC